MKIRSAPFRLFALCSAAIAFFLLGDAGFVSMPEPALEQPCGKPAPGQFGCHLLQRTQAPVAGWNPWRAFAQTTAPSGLHPADIQDAYKLNVSQTAIQETPMVAVIVAFDDPGIEADLGVYRSSFGLPPCTVANGCFRKVNQQGNLSPLPGPSRSWAAEAALAVEMVSAACPKCRILLVEADDDLNDGLFISVPTAVDLGAAAIVTPYGTPEDASAPQIEAQYFRHPGVAIVAPNGNTGDGPVQFPASSQYVIAVGGTTLTRAANARGWNETVWGSPANAGSGTGSGCSAYIAKPAVQVDTVCRMRTVGDVAAVADPNTGVAVYDSYGGTGWVVDGGTEVAASIVAGIYGLAAFSQPLPPYPMEYLYDSPTGLFDVTTGSNGNCANYLCNAQVGYDAPTGLGTPNGLTAFFPPAQDFAISTVPSQGSPDSQGTTRALVTSEAIRGPAETLTLTTKILSPSLLSATVSPSTINTGSLAILTVSISPGPPPGSYQIEVIAKGVQAIHSAIYTLKVLAPTKPQIDFSVAPANIYLGQSASLSWSSTQGPNNCYAEGAWSGGQADEGSQTVSPSTVGTYKYWLICDNDVGTSKKSATLTVTHRPPVITIAVNPAQIVVGQTAELSWDAKYATTCHATDNVAGGNWTGPKNLTGQQVLAPKAPGTFTYPLTCAGPGGTVSSSAVLSVQAPKQ